MSPPTFHILRAILVALVGAASTVIIGKFDDRYSNQSREPYSSFDPSYDDYLD